uniref:Phospholipase C/D domain-containing protein n=1 Tax=Archaeoglobus fulgidus TaxID=2234 RepID=A0A7J3M293_ARCFL
MAKKIISLFLVLVAFKFAISSAMAWGTLTHIRMSSEAGNPYPGRKMEYLSGSIAPDGGYLISNEWGSKFHGYNVGEALRIGNTLFVLSQNSKERAFAKGWLAHLMQDRVAHGNGLGLPRDPAFGVGYSNFAAKKYGIDHISAEFFVNGRVLNEKGWNWDFVTFAVPIDLVIKTMNTLYGQSPPRDRLIDAYNTFAAEYYGELAFWQTPTGKALYISLFMAGTVGDYDDYVQEVNCNPYYTSIYLTNNPQVSRPSILLENSAENEIANIWKGWMREYAKNLEESEALEISRKIEKGWLLIEFKSFDKSKADIVAREMLRNMNLSGKTAEILKFQNSEIE